VLEDPLAGDDVGTRRSRNKTLGAIADERLVLTPKFGTRMMYGLWAQLGEKIRPGEGRFPRKDSARELAVSSLLPFGRGTVCADFAGLRDDVARAEGTNGWISNRT
jgi:hypothetical protein